MLRLSLSFACGIALSLLCAPSILECQIGCAALLLSLFLFCRCSGNAAILSCVCLFCAGAFCTCLQSISCSIGTSLTGRFSSLTLGPMFEAIDNAGFEGEQTSAMIKALLCGRKADLPLQTVQLFRASGASHLLALSGLHLGIIYLVLTALLEPLGHSRAAQCIRTIVITGICICYTLATGAGPSICRACIFICLRETLKVFTSRSLSTKDLFCTALLIQLGINPLIIKSVGFELSYLAMAGIYTVFPVMKDWYQGSSRNPLKRIWDLSCLSISCQLFTAPLSWIYFHSFPKYFLLCNLLAMPVCEITMISAIGTLALQKWAWGAAALSRLTDLGCEALLSIMETISSM